MFILFAMYVRVWMDVVYICLGGVGSRCRSAPMGAHRTAARNGYPRYHYQSDTAVAAKFHRLHKQNGYIKNIAIGGTL